VFAAEPPADPGAVAGISRTTTVIFAVAAGVAVANIYYLQPILAVIAADLHATPRTVGFVSMALQVGYAIGILVFVPLGDLVQRRGLIVGLFGIAAVCLGCAAAAANITLLAAAICAVGIATTAPQILQPFAADLALPSERGRVVGTIQVGLILGTVFARAVSGLLGAYAGWRAVFAFAAAFSACSALVLVRVIPLRDSPVRMRYRHLIASMPGLVRAHPTLRVSMAMGFIVFAMFTGIWTILAFHVRDLGYGSDVVGYVGLISIVGVLTAGRIGSLSDRRGTLVTGTIGWLVSTLSFVLFALIGNTLAGLTVGMAVFALGVQATQISNQVRIFGISDEARSRLNTIFVFSTYAGGAYGSFVCAWVFQEAGWLGVCITCFAHMILMGGVLLWFRSLQSPALKPS
jgi:predicted MFS family arabinose efflux permease